ncbi:hypothetical protein ABMA10_11545 [Plantibacter sp. RU18]
MTPDTEAPTARLYGLLGVSAYSIEQEVVRPGPEDRDGPVNYDSTSRPLVCLRATSKRAWTSAQLTMFQNAFT